MTEQIWAVKSALDWCIDYLESKGDEHPRRSAEWLVSAATGLSRVEVYAYHDRPLTEDERMSLRESVRRRASGEPLQYVTGEVAFRHLVLSVERGVLIPRPETEVLVDEALRALEGVEDPLVADPCTGSGAIALSIAYEHPGARVWATDISPVAVETAAGNCERLKLSHAVSVLPGDLLSPLPESLRGRLDAVVSNPPYIPTADLADLPSEVVGFEPTLALDGGEDGLQVFRRLAVDALDWLTDSGTLFVELDEGRVQVAAAEAVQWYKNVNVVCDLTGRERVLVARRR
jgi:release factor glutamine methyltransferase